MSSTSILSLPSYPSSQIRKALSPSQLSGLNRSIATSLLQTIALPPTKRDTSATRNFVASYAKDNALLTLHELIWEKTGQSKDEKLVQKRVLTLSEKVASSQAGLELPTLLDLAIVYAQNNHSRMKSIFAEAVKSNPDLIRTVETDLVLAFNQLLSVGQAQGLYSVRKTAHCILSFLTSSPPELIRPFTHNKPFIVSLAALYDQGMTSIATSYGGLASMQTTTREPDEWEPIWVQTKVSLVDAFHVLINTLLSDLTVASGAALAVESERTFDTIFALLELPQSSGSGSGTPFLDRSLLADYQQSYSLTKTLNSALRHAKEKDARLDLLEATLQSFEETSSSSGEGSKNPGAIKILLRSSGISPGMDNLGNGSKVPSSIPVQKTGDPKGKMKAPSPQPSSSTHIPDLDLKVTQVLDILPDQTISYVRALLEADPYNGNPEKVIEALLDGTAPPMEVLAAQPSSPANFGVASANVDEVSQYVNERRNIFDDEVMDVSQLRFGKKKDVTETVLRDRSFIEQMKADILRRAEAISDDEEEEDENSAANPQAAATSTKSAQKGKSEAFDEEEDIIVGAGNLKVGGDGEESDESDAEHQDQGDEVEPVQSPETILELAYISDPKLFDRDAATRRSKARAELKERTKMGDEQIEGWRIMLERNPNKEKILGKHEFSGNQPSLPVASGSEGAGRGGRGGGRGGRGGRGGGGGGPRGRGRGRGGGGGGGGSGGPSGGDNAKDRAWKDKNKARQANHDRKRGHDKKLAKMGGPSS